MSSDKEDRIADLACVSAFLVYAEAESEMLGGHTATNALEAFARLFNIPVEALRTIHHDYIGTEEIKP